MEPSETAQQPQHPPDSAEQPQPPAIDIRQLADRVYRLMLEEIRLEQARGDRGVRRSVR